MKSENKIYQIYYSYTKYGGLENYLDNIIKFSKYENIKINLEKNSYLKLSNFRFLNPIIRNINKKNYLLHFHGFNPSIIFEIFRIKDNGHIIWTPHFHTPESTNRKFLSYLNLIFAFLLLKSKKINVICQYYEEKLFLKKILKNSIFYIIPTGHKFAKYVNKKKIFDAIYIARNEKQKNLDLYIKLVKKFKKKKFCLITNKINLKIQNLKVFSNVDDLKKNNLISCSRFFVNTSNFEAFGIASAESELFGTPSVHNKSIMYHMLEKKNETLLLYKRNNLKSLIKIFSHLLNLKKKDYHALCDSRIKFSKKYVFQKQIKFFDRLFSNVKKKIDNEQN